MRIRTTLNWPCVLVAQLCMATLWGPTCNAQGLTTQIESLAKPYVDSKTVMGLSIGVVKDGHTAQVHLGKTSASGAKPNGDTVYEIGSASKVFTGILLGDAVTSGDVQLDQRAQELLAPGVTMPKGKNGGEIKLVDLSTHMSGLPRLPDNMPSLTSKDPYADYTSKLAFAFLNKHKLQREPGAKQEYSNFAASLLGHLLCRKAGKSYDDLMAARITGPLKMTDTRVQLNPSMKARLAPPHSASGDLDSNWGFADMPGAGGIRSTTNDMLKFAQACLKSPEGSVGKAMDLAWQEHSAGGGGAKLGLGWHFAGDGSTRWHNGQTGGYHSMIMVNRGLNAAVVVLTNTSTGEVDQLAAQVIQTLAGAKHQPRKFAAGVKIDTKKMKRLEGKYQLAPTFVFTVKVKNGKLMVGVTNQPTMEVFPKSETEWFYKAVKATLTFDINANGKCTSLELFQNGVRQTAKRIK